jgi:flavin-dependent dehydrogenase
MSATDAWDIAVVGSGPAGSSAAIAAAEAGARTLFLEKDAFPGQTNVCAGGIPAQLAEDLRLPEGMVEKRILGTVHFFPWGETPVRRSEPIHVCLNRPKLDAFLASRAEQSGATLKTQTTVEEIGRASCRERV